MSAERSDAGMAAHRRLLCASMVEVVKTPLTAEMAVATAPASERAEARRARRWVWIYELVVVVGGYMALLEDPQLGHRRRGRGRPARARRRVGSSGRCGCTTSTSSTTSSRAHDWLAYICNYYYATLHFIVTISVGIWLYRRHPLHARQLRTAWYLMNFLALFGFAFFPLAPPRLLPGGGYTDTVVAFHTWGSWGDQSVSSHSNLYAAMPSMHIGWSLWVAISVVFLARRTWVRVLGRLLSVRHAVRDHRDRQPLLARCRRRCGRLSERLRRGAGRHPTSDPAEGGQPRRPCPGARRGPLDDAERPRPVSAPAEEVRDERDGDVGDLVERPVSDPR